MLAEYSRKTKPLAATRTGCYIEQQFSFGLGAPKGEGDGRRLRRHSHWWGPQRASRWGLPGPRRFAHGGARGPRRGRGGGEDRRAVSRGSGVQGDYLLVRREPHAQAH